MYSISLSYLPNIISILRIFLTIPIIYLLWVESYSFAFFLIFIAALSDGLDGFLARHYSWQSELGALLDPIADKILLVSLVIIFTAKGELPNWLMLIIVSRDVIIFVGALVYRWVTGAIKMQPLLISKVNTLLQISLVLLVAMKVADFWVSLPLLNAMIQVVALSTLLSGLSYVVLWTKYALQGNK